MLVLALLAGCDDGHKATGKRGAVATPVPKTLADGSRPASLPVALRRFRGRPVLGAKELSAGSSPIRSRCLDPYTRARASFSSAWLSTDGLTVEYAVRRYPGVALITCDEIRVGNRWLRCGGGVARSRDPHRIELAGAGLSIVCHDRAESPSFMWIAVPVATRWTLVDHDAFWVAYRSTHRRLIRASKAGRTYRFGVAFVDERGRLLAERRITGAVAG